MTQPSTPKKTTSPRRQRKASAPVQETESLTQLEAEEVIQSKPLNGIAASSSQEADTSTATTLNTSAENVEVGQGQLETQVDEPTPPTELPSKEAINPEEELLHTTAIELSSKEAIAEWQPAASFTVTVQSRTCDGQTEYQTVIHQIDSNETMIESGIQIHQLQDWLEVQFKPQKSEFAEPSPPPEVEVISVAHPLAIKIHQLAITQPVEVGTAMVVDRMNQVFLNPIQSHQTFALAIAFEITGLEDIHSNAAFIYTAQVYARHRYTGDTVLLSSIEDTEPVGQNFCYQASIPEVMFEVPGFYRLQVLINVKQAIAPSGYFEVPILQVI